MSSHIHTQPRPDWAKPPGAPRRRRRWLIPGTIIAVAVIVMAVIAVSASEGSRASDTKAKDSQTDLQPTGERNQMGMPVVSTPGSATGTESAGGVETTAANWDLGRVPLNVAVRPTWTLRNTTNSVVTLGQPKAEVRTGCCPGPVNLDTQTLAPGEQATVTFELSMHPGMDGAHDLALHVPVEGAGATGSDLTLSVVGDFRS